jgi:hypothetical protein
MSALMGVIPEKPAQNASQLATGSLIEFLCHGFDHLPFVDFATVFNSLLGPAQ